MSACCIVSFIVNELWLRIYLLHNDATEAVGDEDDGPCSLQAVSDVYVYSCSDAYCRSESEISQGREETFGVSEASLGLSFGGYSNVISVGHDTNVLDLQGQEISEPKDAVAMLPGSERVSIEAVYCNDACYF